MPALTLQSRLTTEMAEVRIPVEDHDRQTRDIRLIADVVESQDKQIQQNKQRNYDPLFIETYGGYEKGTILVLSNGLEVVAVKDNVNTNPNNDLTGWEIKKTDLSQIYDKEDGKSISQKYALVINSIEDLKTYSKGKPEQVVYVESYILGKSGGGGYFILKTDFTDTPDEVYSFEGLGGIWLRYDWKSPDIYDAGILDLAVDVTVKFKSLLKSTSKYLKKSVISLRAQTLKLTDLEIPSNTTIIDGVMDFSASTSILADNKSYNGFIIGANRLNRTSNPGVFAAYSQLDQLENIAFERVGFKVPPAGTYGFSTDLMYFHKLNGFKLKSCYGLDFNSNRIVTIAGGMDGTVTSNDIPMFSLIDPVNGRCAGIEISDNQFDAGHSFGVNSGGQRLIVPAMRLTGCSDIKISKNNFKNFNIPILVDAYCRDAEAFDNTCSIDDEVLDIWLSTTSRTDQVGLYGGQGAYNIRFYNNTLKNFINKAIMLEGVSYSEIYSNISTYSDYAKTLISSTSLFYGIQLNSNIRQHPYTSVAGVQHVNVYNNRMIDAKSPFIMSSTTAYSMKSIRVNDNSFESIGSQMAMTVNRCFDSVFTNNRCKGGLSIGEVKDSSFSLNSMQTPSNYALYLTGSEKLNLRFQNNDFVCDSGPVIYNGTTSGNLIELRGGKIQAKDGTSAALQNGASAGAIRAYDFTNGLVEMRTTISDKPVNLAAAARVLLSQTVTGLKNGWTANISLGSMGTLWSGSSIDLSIKAGVKTDTVDILVRNESAAAVNFTPTLTVEFKSFLSNVYTN